jgi:poly-gamma-glutamate synthesis protein (capsule biosynthesis protein)
MVTTTGTSAIRPAAGAARPDPADHASGITLFLGGDVMIGRGIDHILPHLSDPRLYEPVMHTARGYVELAIQAHGPIPAPVDFAYIWGDALEVFTRLAPDVRIINLETAVTTSAMPWPGKGIHYRVHPANLPCLTAAHIDCGVLSNNHVLDWGSAGLAETLDALYAVPVQTAGAGRTLAPAVVLAVLDVAGKGRVLVWGAGVATSGIPPSWAATPHRPEVHLLPDLSAATVRAMAAHVQAHKHARDLAVVSLHWGGNWGYGVPAEQRRFAPQLIAEAGVDIVHGHSSHHPKGIEVFRGKLILYGCGDLLNDYEGIGGFEAFHGDVTVLYFAPVDPARAGCSA